MIVRGLKKTQHLTFMEITRESAHIYFRYSEWEEAQENMVTKITWWLIIHNTSECPSPGTKRNTMNVKHWGARWLIWKGRLWLNHHDCFSDSLSLELRVCEVQITLKTGKKISMIRSCYRIWRWCAEWREESKRIGFFNLKMSIITTNCYLLSK